MKNRTWTKNIHTEGLDRAGRVIQLLSFVLLSVGLVSVANAGPREQAKRIHDRLAGVPPSDAVLQQMEDAINPALPGTAADAAVIAMNDVNFYNVTLKNFAAPWTNRDQSVFVPLNDYIATVIGMIRDDVPFNTLLSADLTYVGNNGVVPSNPSAANNDHYAQLEANNINLRDELTNVSQSSVSGIPSSATAGIITGSVVIEQIFGIPGIGRYFVQGALNRDYTLVMGVVVFYGALIIVFNFLVDVLYAQLDPRVKFG